MPLIARVYPNGQKDVNKKMFKHIREQADSGRPTVIADPDGPIAQAYKAIARKVAVSVAQKAADFSARFPNIVIQNT